MINMLLLLIIPRHNSAHRLWEYSNLSGTGYYLDPTPSSWNLFIRKYVAAGGGELTMNKSYLGS